MSQTLHRPYHEADCLHIYNVYSVKREGGMGSKLDGRNTEKGKLAYCLLRRHGVALRDRNST